MNKSFLKFIAVVFWIAVWWTVAKITDSFLIPSPEETVNAMYHVIVSGGFFMTLLVSLFRILVGFIISSVFGIILGVLAGLYQNVDIFLKPVISVIKSIPVISLILIILFWAHSSVTPIVVCTLMCLPVIYNSVYDGIKNVDSKLLKMARLYRMKGIDVIKYIYIHSIKPYLFTAARSCLNLGFRVTVAAEVLSNPKFGFGTKLFDSKVYLNISELFAWTAMIVFLSYLFELALTYLMKKYTVKGAYTDAAD